MLVLDDLLLAGAAAVAGAGAARWGARLDAKFAQTYGDELKIDALTANLFNAECVELAWDEVLWTLKAKDKTLNRYLSSLGDYWDTREEFNRAVNACENEKQLCQLFKERWAIRAPVATAHATYFGRFVGEAIEAATDPAAFEQGMEGERRLKNYHTALESIGKLGAAVRQLKKLTGSVFEVREQFLEADRDRMQRNPEDKHSSRAQAAIAELWGEESSEHRVAEKIADVDREIHTAFIMSDERHLLLRRDLLAMRAATLEQLLPFFPDYKLSLMLEGEGPLAEKTIYLKPQEEQETAQQENFCKVEYEVLLEGEKMSGTITIRNPEPLSGSNVDALAVFNKNKKEILEALAGNQHIPPSASLHHEIDASVLDLRVQSKELNEDWWLFIKYQLVEYLLYFTPAVMLAVGLVVAVIAPWAVTAASFWMMGVGCAAGLVGGFWCLHQFLRGESVENLFERFEQMHGSVFSHLLRRSYKKRSVSLTKTGDNIQRSIDELRKLMIAKLNKYEGCGKEFDGQRKILKGILDALDMCGAYAESWQDALDAVLDGIKALNDPDLLANCKEHISAVSSAAPRQMEEVVDPKLLEKISELPEKSSPLDEVNSGLSGASGGTQPEPGEEPDPNAVDGVVESARRVEGEEMELTGDVSRNVSEQGADLDPGTGSGSGSSNSELNHGVVDSGILAGDDGVVFNGSEQGGVFSTERANSDPSHHGEGGEQAPDAIAVVTAQESAEQSLANTGPASRPPATSSNQPGCFDQFLTGGCYGFFSAPRCISKSAKWAVEKSKGQSQKSTQGPAAKSKGHLQESAPAGYAMRARAF
jgi:hypothetical protein